MANTKIRPATHNQVDTQTRKRIAKEIYCPKKTESSKQQKHSNKIIDYTQNMQNAAKKKNQKKNNHKKTELPGPLGGDDHQLVMQT